MGWNKKTTAVGFPAAEFFAVIFNRLGRRGLCPFAARFVNTSAVRQSLMTLTLIMPSMLEKSNFSDIVCRELNLNPGACNLTEWNKMLKKIENRTKDVTIALVGKYVQLHDAYLSIAESLNHAGFETGINVNIKWIDSELVTQYTAKDLLGDCNGILVPGGFGSRGIEGKIAAVKYARENNVPYLGICLGMQAAVIEFARNVLNYPEAHSSEFKEGPHSVINIMDNQKDQTQKGGTMRLGAYPCRIKEDSLLHRCYKASEIQERHRHRYEFNNEYREIYEENGMKISGVSPNGLLVEAVEIPENDFFIGVQYHPEFKSRPNHPHPLFVGFVEAAGKHKV